MVENKFNEDYYERGVEKKLSGYTNYKWKPEYSLPCANMLKKRYGKVSMLDYGCAKGYLVKALRLLDVPAFGYDISEYAIENCDPAVKELVNFDVVRPCDVIIAKDTLEHVPYNEMDKVLKEIRDNCIKAFVVVPLGENKLFRIREYEVDVTHIIREDEEWWMNKFIEAGFEIEEFHYAYEGVKENWTSKYPFGNGIFFLR